MFWTGMIVGVVTGVAATFGVSLYHCAKTAGSLGKWGDICEMIDVANDNRESEIQVWHNGELLNTVVLEEDE